MTNRYQLIFKQKSCQYISPWKISKLIDDLTGDYYKKNLIHNIADELSALDEDEYLVIFNNSFDTYHSYNKLDDFSFEDKDDVLNLYWLGNPIPIKPNIQIMKMSLLFEIHRRLYTKLNSIDITMEREKIVEYLKVNFNDEDKFDFQLIKEYLNKLLNSSDKKHNKILSECNELIGKFESKLDKFSEDSIQFDLIDGLENEKELKEYLKKEKNLKVYDKYYSKFEKTFNSLGRPIVGVVNLKKRTLSVLAKEFIREDLKNLNKERIEMVELRRNSPTMMTYIVGTIVLPWLAQLLITKKESKKINNQGKSKTEDIEIEIHPEITKLENQIKEYQEAESDEESFDDKVASLSDYKLRKNLVSMNRKITEDTNKSLKKNNFRIDKLELITPQSKDEKDIENLENEGESKVIEDIEEQDDKQKI